MPLTPVTFWTLCLTLFSQGVSWEAFSHQGKCKRLLPFYPTIVNYLTCANFFFPFLYFHFSRNLKFSSQCCFLFILTPDSWFYCIRTKECKRRLDLNKSVNLHSCTLFTNIHVSMHLTLIRFLWYTMEAYIQLSLNKFKIDLLKAINIWYICEISVITMHTGSDWDCV